MTIFLHKNYTILGGRVQLTLPLDVDVLIPADDSVRLLSLILEELDYRRLYQAYSYKGRKTAVDPKILFKLLVYGCMRNIHSSRELERACISDLNFLWLLEGKPRPDHNTIARFRRYRLAEGVLEDLFYQFIKKLIALDGELLDVVFIDGTKMEAYANKYTFVWKKATMKYEAKLQEKIRKHLESLGYTLDTDKAITVAQMVVIYEKLMEEAQQLEVEFVHGKGARKTKLQKDIETLEAHIEKQRTYDEYNAIFDGRNSFSKTDKEATFMRMKDDHMRNAQLKPGYNTQFAVAGEFIVGLDISSERSDSLTLIPFMERLKNAYGEIIKSVVCDAGYESEENYEYLKSENINGYIKPANYESSKKKNKHIGKRENMDYSPEEDTYTCKNGKLLVPAGTTKRTSKSGYETVATIYECESCEGCPLKTQCSKAQGNKRLQVSKRFLALREESLEKITSDEGVLYRVNRSIQAEGAIGVVKEDYGFRRFSMRGTENVRIESLLMAFGYNVNKLHNKIQQDRMDHKLHTPKKAA